MFPLIFAIALSLLGSLWLIRFHRTRKLPPGPWGLPIIGSLHLLGSLPHSNLQRLATKYGHIMSLRLGSKLTVVVSSPRAAELFLKTHDSVFASRPKVKSAEIFFYGAKGMALTPYGPYWRSVRKFCTLELLSPAKIDGLARMRSGELGSVVKSLKESASAREVVNVSETIITLIEDVTYKMLFGNIKNENFDIKACIVDYMHLTGAFDLSDYVPFLRPLDLQGLKKRMIATANKIDKILEIMIDEHEQNARMGIQKRDMDFIDVMLSQKNKSTDTQDESSYIIDRTNIKAVVLDMIAGTLDTSYTAIESLQENTFFVTKCFATKNIS